MNDIPDGFKMTEQRMLPEGWVVVKPRERLNKVKFFLGCV